MKTTEKQEVIRLETSHSIADAERLLSRIRTADPNTDLLASTDLKNHHFAGTAAYMQLFITWIRHCPKGRLRIHVQGNDDDDRTKTVLSRFIGTDYGAIATALAGSIWTRDGERQLTAQAQPFLHKRLAEMDDREQLPWKGPKLFAMCVDESSYEAPRMLYRPRESMSREPEVLPVAAFQALAIRIAQRFATGTKGATLASTGSLSSMLFELFRNTHHWARSDAAEKAYGPSLSVRGFRVQRHELETEEEKQMVANMPPLRDFFSNPELGPTPKRRYFAEVTVFDSGPGVSTRRMLSRQQGQQPPGLGVEHSALLDCLKKHISTAAAETKGKGLHRVLQDLTSLGAFLWLRCGRLSLYRDFLAMPYKPEHASDEPFLLDWTGGIGGLTEVPSVEGSFFTALIPMADDFGQATLWPRK